MAGPGTYVAEVFGFADETSFELRCAVGSVPAATARSPDLKALQAVLDQCCSHGSSGSSSCPALRASLDDAEAGGPGPCGVPPNECDRSGHLTTLSLAGDGLRCSFPTALDDLSGSLRELDLSLNDLDGDFGSHLAPVLSKLPKLEAVSLSLNRIRGQLSCKLIGAEENGEGSRSSSSSSGKKHHSSSSSPLPSRLSRFTATHNRLSGPIPACLLDPSKSPIQELSLAVNELSGKLPRIGDERDVEEEGEKKSSAAPLSPLRVLSLGEQAGGGFEGDLPCLACAPVLEVVELQGSSLGGVLPRLLPPRLRELRLSGNGIGGGIPSWPSDSLALLEVLSLDGNAFGGGGGGGDRAEIPAALSGAPSLRLLSAAGSGLGGDLPSEDWGPSLERVLLGNNSFTGEVPAALARVPGLELLDLSRNRLSGELGAFADALEGAQGARRGALRYLNLASNDLEGKVPQGLAAAGALSPGAWGAIPVFSGGSHGGGSGSGRSPSAAAAGVVVLRKTLNLTDNRLTGPLPDFLVRAMAEDKDVEIGLGGERNDFDCPKRGGKIAVSRAMPKSVAEGVSCRVQGSGGERKSVEEVIEVREDAGERRSSSSSSSSRHDGEDEDDDRRSSSSSKSKRGGGFAPKAAEAKSGLSRPVGSEEEEEEGDNLRRASSSSPSSSSHDHRSEQHDHRHRHRSLAATLGLVLVHLVGWCSLGALGLAAWRHREALVGKLRAVRSALPPPPLSGLLRGGNGNNSFAADGYSGLGGGGSSSGLRGGDDTLEMIDVDFAADAFQPDARAFSEKDSLLVAAGGAVVEVKVRAGGICDEENGGGGASASSQTPPPPSQQQQQPSNSNAPSETIGAYRPPQHPPAGYQD